MRVLAVVVLLLLAGCSDSREQTCTTGEYDGQPFEICVDQ